jgi:hypothetical protein
VVYLYFGNPGASPQANPAAVWDAGYVGVYHLGDPVTNEENGGVHADSTIYGHHAVQYGNYRSTGKIGYAQDLGTSSGENDFIEVASLSGTEAPIITMSCWLHSDDAGNIGTNLAAQRCVTQRRALSNSRLAIGIDDDALAVYWIEVDAQDDLVGYLYRGGTTLVDDTWYHAAVTYDGSVIRLFLNGVEDAAAASTGTMVPPWDSTGTPDRGGFVIGAGSSQTDRTLDGVIDEVRISNTARSAAWIKASHDNQADPASFAVRGPREDI